MMASALDTWHDGWMSESDIITWIRANLNKAGKSQAGLAAVLGVHPSAVSRMLAGERRIGAEEFLKIREYLEIPPPIGISPPQHTPDVPLRFVIAGGVWREAGVAPVHNGTQVSAVLHPKFPVQDQYACRVEGKDFNKLIPPGQFVVCVPFKSVRTKPEEGDIVHVQRRRGDLQEDTLRKVRITKRGVELWPASDDPAFQKPLLYQDDREGETTEIVGLLISSSRLWVPTPEA